MHESLADVANERNGLRRIISNYRQLQQTYGDAQPLTVHAEALRYAIKTSDIKRAERVLALIEWELDSGGIAGGWQPRASDGGRLA